MRYLIPAATIALLSLAPAQADATVVDYTGVSIVNNGPSINSVPNIGIPIPAGSTFNLTDLGDNLQVGQSGALNNAFLTYTLEDAQKAQEGFATGYVSDNERIVFQFAPNTTLGIGNTSRTYAMPDGPLSILPATSIDGPLTTTFGGMFDTDTVTFAALDVPAGGYFLLGFASLPSDITISYRVSAVPLSSSLPMMAIALGVLVAAGPLRRRMSIDGKQHAV